MRIVRYAAAPEQSAWGILDGERLLPLAGAPYPQPLQTTGLVLDAATVSFLAPCRPTKIVCVGLNYRDHAAEMNLALPKEPLLFLKPPSSLIGPNEAIEAPPQTSNLHYEAELAIVIGKRVKQVAIEQARSAIFGYSCANDVTARDLQMSDGQWTRGKSFDTFLPLGPWIETELDPSALQITLRVNGELRQQSTTANLLFSPAELVAYISQIMTLEPGDLILTGTPAGVGAMKPGDRVEVFIDGLGSLTNPVIQRRVDEQIV